MNTKVIPRKLESAASFAFYSSARDRVAAFMAYSRFVQEVTSGVLTTDDATALLEDSEKVMAYVKDTPPLSPTGDTKAIVDSMEYIVRTIVGVHLHLHGMDAGIQQTHRDFVRAHSDSEAMMKALKANAEQTQKLQTLLGTVSHNIEKEVINGIKRSNRNTALKSAIVLGLVVGCASSLVGNFLYEGLHSDIERYLPPSPVVTEFSDCKQSITLPNGQTLYICPPSEHPAAEATALVQITPRPANRNIRPESQRPDDRHPSIIQAKKANR